jgi:hypothetical protein
MKARDVMVSLVSRTTHRRLNHPGSRNRSAFGGDYACLNHITGEAVCTENLSPNVMMMKPAKDRV